MRNKDNKSAIQTEFQRRGWQKPDHLTWRQVQGWLYDPAKKDRTFKPSTGDPDWAEILNRHRLPFNPQPTASTAGTNTARPGSTASGDPPADRAATTDGNASADAGTAAAASAQADTTGATPATRPAASTDVAGAIHCCTTCSHTHSRTQHVTSKAGTAARARAAARGIVEPALPTQTGSSTHEAETRSTGRHTSQVKHRRHGEARPRTASQPAPPVQTEAAHPPHRDLVSWLE